jgi:hypothetical protein
MNPTAIRRWIGLSAVVVAAAGAAAGISLGNLSGSDPHPSAPVHITVTQWMHNGGSRLIHTLGDDFTALNGPNKAFDLPAMAAGCNHLLADVRSAQAYPAVPDATIEPLWSTALDLYALGAADCARGSATHNYSLIITSAKELSKGTDNLRSTDQIAV